MMGIDKWYWGYEDNGFTWIFDCIEKARDHAVEKGVFDEICGKDAMMDFDESLFFEILESELEEVQPYQII